MFGLYGYEFGERVATKTIRRRGSSAELAQEGVAVEAGVTPPIRIEMCDAGGEHPLGGDVVQVDQLAAHGVRPGQHFVGHRARISTRRRVVPAEHDRRDGDPAPARRAHQELVVIERAQAGDDDHVRAMALEDDIVEVRSEQAAFRGQKRPPQRRHAPRTCAAVPYPSSPRRRRRRRRPCVPCSRSRTAMRHRISPGRDTAAVEEVAELAQHRLQPGGPEVPLAFRARDDLDGDPRSSRERLQVVTRAPRPRSRPALRLASSVGRMSVCSR